MEESPPTVSDRILKTRRQSLLDSPGRVTRGQLRSLSNVISSDTPKSPQLSPTRRSRLSRAGNEEKESETYSPPRRGRALKVQNEGSMATSSPVRRTRGSRTVSGAPEETSQESTTSRRMSNRLQSIVENTSGITTRRTSSRAKQSPPKLQVPLTTRRTRQTSLSSVSSMTSSVASPSRRTRSQKKLSPVASPTASERSSVSPDERKVSSPTNRDILLSNGRPEKSQSSSPKRTKRSLSVEARLSSGKKVGVVSPSRVSPLNTDFTSKNVSVITPRRLNMDDSDSPVRSGVGSEDSSSSSDSPQRFETTPGKAPAEKYSTESNSERITLVSSQFSSSSKTLSEEKPKSPKKSTAYIVVHGQTAPDKPKTPESQASKVSLPFSKSPFEACVSQAIIVQQCQKGANQEVSEKSPGVSALSQRTSNRLSSSSWKSSSPGINIPESSVTDDARNKKSLTCDVPDHRMSSSVVEAVEPVEDELMKQNTAKSSKSPPKSPVQEICAPSNVSGKYGKSTPNKTVDGKNTAKWLETVVRSDSPGKTPEKSPESNKMKDQGSERKLALEAVFRKSPHTDFVQSLVKSPKPVKSCHESSSSVDDEVVSSPDILNVSRKLSLKLTKSGESEHFNRSVSEVSESIVSPKLIPVLGGVAAKKTSQESPDGSRDVFETEGEASPRTKSVSVEYSKETLRSQTGETGKEEVTVLHEESSTISCSAEKKSKPPKTRREVDKFKNTSRKSFPLQQAIVCVDYDSDETIHLSEEEKNYKSSTAPVQISAKSPIPAAGVGNNTDSELSNVSSSLSRETLRKSLTLSANTHNSNSGTTPEKRSANSAIASVTPKGITLDKTSGNEGSAASMTNSATKTGFKPFASSTDGDTDSEPELFDSHGEPSLRHKQDIPASNKVADVTEDTMNSRIVSRKSSEMNCSSENLASSLSEEESSKHAVVESPVGQKPVTPCKHSSDESQSHNSSQKITLQIDATDDDSESEEVSAAKAPKPKKASWDVSSKVMRDVANLLNHDFPSGDEGSEDEQVWGPVFSPSAKSKKEMRAEKKEKRRAEKEARKKAKIILRAKHTSALSVKHDEESPVQSLLKDRDDELTSGKSKHDISEENSANSSGEIGSTPPVELNKSFTAADFYELFSDESDEVSTIKEKAPKKTKAEKKAEKKLRKMEQKLSKLRENTGKSTEHRKGSENIKNHEECEVESKISEKAEGFLEAGEILEQEQSKKLDGVLGGEWALPSKTEEKRKKQANEGDEELNMKVKRKKKKVHGNEAETEETKPIKKNKKASNDEIASETLMEPSVSTVNLSKKRKLKSGHDADTEGSVMKTKLDQNELCCSLERRQKKKLKKQKRLGDETVGTGKVKMSQGKVVEATEVPLKNDISRGPVNGVQDPVAAPLKKKKLDKQAGGEKFKRRKRDVEVDSMETEGMKMKKKKKKEHILKGAAVDLPKKGKPSKSSEPTMESCDGSDSEAPTSVSFSAGREAALAALEAATLSIQSQQQVKREKRRLKLLKLQEQKAEKFIRLQKKLKKKEKALKAQETEGNSGFNEHGIPKRLPDDMLKALTEKQRTAVSEANILEKNMSVSLPTKEEEQQRLERKRARKLAKRLEQHKLKKLEYIPVDAGSSGATRFGIVPLRNIMANRNKMAEEATSFRKEMLFGNRVKRTPVTEMLAYQEKLAAAGKDKLVRASQ